MFDKYDFASIKLYLKRKVSKQTIELIRRTELSAQVTCIFNIETYFPPEGSALSVGREEHVAIARAKRGFTSIRKMASVITKLLVVRHANCRW